jgi:uncharacterized protein (DUF736 family)
MGLREFDIAVATEDGHFVSEKHERIAAMIRDVDETLQLVWIPPENRVENDTAPPFAVVCTPRDRQPYIVFTIKEDEFDERVIARLINGDLAHNDPLAWAQAVEDAEEAYKLKQRMDKAEERMDFVKTVVGSGKHSFRHNGKIIPT